MTKATLHAQLAAIPLLMRGSVRITCGVQLVELLTALLAAAAAHVTCANRRGNVGLDLFTRHSRGCLRGWVAGRVDLIEVQATVFIAVNITIAHGSAQFGLDLLTRKASKRRGTGKSRGARHGCGYKDQGGNCKI